MNYHSRKFLLTIGMIGLSTGLLLSDAISQTTWRDVIFLCLGGYFTANVTQKAVTKPE